MLHLGRNLAYCLQRACAIQTAAACERAAQRLNRPSAPLTSSAIQLWECMNWTPQENSKETFPNLRTTGCRLRGQEAFNSWPWTCLLPRLLRCRTAEFMLALRWSWQALARMEEPWKKQSKAFLAAGQLCTACQVCRFACHVDRKRKTCESDQVPAGAPSHAAC